jgi:hypothetical protein
MDTQDKIIFVFAAALILIGALNIDKLMVM